MAIKEPTSVADRANLYKNVITIRDRDNGISKILCLIVCFLLQVLNRTSETIY
jgi:hypothetical protein